MTQVTSLNRFQPFIIILLLMNIIGCQDSSRAGVPGFSLISTVNLQSSNQTETPDMPEIELPDSRTYAPEFPHDFAWVNTDRPLFLHNELKGRVVVLDFWTYCCINCMHVLPDLAYIEEKYSGQPIIVIGVHSAKFDNEGDAENIRTACYRYDIKHPVIVDENHRIWSDFAVRAWPTLVVIDPEGRIVGSLSGEGNREILDNVVHALLKEGERKGTLASGPPEYKQKARVPSNSGLAFPGKVLADSASGLLFISDSNHNRIIISTLNGNVQKIAGSGKSGQSDGTFSEAEFNHPQGMAFDAAYQVLYRKHDLKSEQVTTLSGTGKQVYDRSGGGIGTAQGLNSPWDLALHDSILFIAMAGPHQIWTLNLENNIAEAWVGSGSENIVDGSGMSASLAQPSGLTIVGDWMYFADSEVSAVRRANLKTRKVETLIGSGLFDFGDRIGAFSNSQLQHPLGVAVYNGDILVSDTYNHRIKRLDTDKKESHYLIGTGKPESDAESQPSLYEPGGLSVSGDILFIADTNHDRIIRADLKTSTWSILELKGLRTRQMQNSDFSNAIPASITVKAGTPVQFEIAPELPAGIHLNSQAPINWVFMSESPSSINHEGIAESNKLPIRFTIPDSTVTNNNPYLLSLSFAYCTDKDQGLCVPVTLSWKLSISRNSSASNSIALSAPVELITE
jgi:thiol-disulfide isomerase/thioredoxin